MTPTGEIYRANAPDLLTWVQATASYGFAEAYSRFVEPLRFPDFDRFLKESVPAARLYGVPAMPMTYGDLQALFLSRRDRLEASPIVFEFLEIMRNAAILPRPFRPLQPLFVRGAVEITPAWVRDRLDLEEHRLAGWQRPLVRMAGALADRIVLQSSPAVQACRRLGLPHDYLYRA